MRVAAKPVVMGVPVLLALAAAAFLAVWVWGPAGTSFTEKGSINGVIEWTVRDASGAIKAHDIIHNVASVRLLDDARTRLSTNVTTGTALYTSIMLCNADANASAPAGFTPTQCTLSSNIGVNPSALLTVSNLGTSDYQVSNLFTSTTGGTTVQELQLVKIPVDTEAPSSANIGAVQDVNIVLAAGDTLTVTWKVTLS